MVTMSYARATRGVAVLEVTGQFDEASAAVLRTGLVDALGSNGPRLVLDLRSMDSCGDAGLVAIGDAACRASRRGGWLRVVAESPQAGRALGPLVFASVPDAVSAR